MAIDTGRGTRRRSPWLKKQDLDRRIEGLLDGLADLGEPPAAGGPLTPRRIEPAELVRRLRPLLSLN